MFSSTARTLPSDRARLLLTRVVVGFSLTTEAVVFSSDGFELLVVGTTPLCVVLSLTAVGSVRLSNTASFFAVGVATSDLASLFEVGAFSPSADFLSLALVAFSALTLSNTLVKSATLLFISSWVAFSLVNNNSASLIAFSSSATTSGLFPTNLSSFACNKILSNLDLSTTTFSETTAFSVADVSFGVAVSLDSAFGCVLSTSFEVVSPCEAELSAATTAVTSAFAVWSLAWAGAANANPPAKNKVHPKTICLPFFTIRQFFCTALFLLNNI